MEPLEFEEIKNNEIEIDNLTEVFEGVSSSEEVYSIICTCSKCGNIVSYMMSVAFASDTTVQ